MITSLSEIVYESAATIDENFLRVGAMEIYLGHVNSSETGHREISTLLVSSIDEVRRRKRRYSQDFEPHPGCDERKQDHLRTS